MTLIGSVPRRCVNLPPGSLKTLASLFLRDMIQQGPAVDAFPKRFAGWLGSPHVFGVSSGRSAFQLALEALELKRGAEIIFPVFTFPVIPMVAKLLGYTPVFCDVDQDTYNAGPEHFEAKITDNTGAILATHLFGQPCPIDTIADMARQRNIRLLEDCAHACGVRVGSRQVGTFGDIGIFSFAEGKNMPCFGGGAIATSDGKIAQRAERILQESSLPSKNAITKMAVSIWIKWLLTRPFVFGITAYPFLRLQSSLGRPLMDSAVGDELLEEFTKSKPRVSRMTNLQAAIGLLQLDHIDSFNEGARRNARILTEKLRGVPGVRTPDQKGEDHIYVYYPLTVEPQQRDSLRHYLLEKGFDTKTSDMADCTVLKPFKDAEQPNNNHFNPKEASILEICVYPVIAEKEMHRLGDTITAWASLAKGDT